MQKVRTFFHFVGKAIRLFTFSSSLVSVVGIVFLLSPQGYASAVDWRDHRVTVEIARNINITDVADRLKREDFRQINCLAQNMYFEAGNQGQAGMAAVGDVVFNRLKFGVFPDGVCQVIDGGKRDQRGKLLNGCDFSWRCDGLPHQVNDRALYGRAYEVAYNQYLYRGKMPSLVGDARYYHADYVSPKNGIWKHVCPVRKIGVHIFYTDTCARREAEG